MRQHWPECYSTSSTSVSTWTNGWRNMAWNRCGQGGAQVRNSEWSHMVNEHRDFDAGQMGVSVVRRVGFGLPHHRALHGRCGFRERTARLDVARVFPASDRSDSCLQWNFSDVNPPVHAWATIFLYRTEQALKGEGDLDFLKRSFAKLMLNFSWWVNRKDRFGKNLFEGGFLGLDNIGVFDRSAACPLVAILSRLTALRGCRCFARICLRSASNWQLTTPSFKTWPLSLLTISFSSPKR